MPVLGMRVIAARKALFFSAISWVMAQTRARWSKLSPDMPPRGRHFQQCDLLESEHPQALGRRAGTATLLERDANATGPSPSRCLPRHTFATLTIMDGVNAVWVGRQMGHASSRMTLDVYARWIDKADRGRERDKASVAFRRTEIVAKDGCKYPPAEPGALDCEPLKAAWRGR
jgi:hypothetical protein